MLSHEKKGNFWTWGLAMLGAGFILTGLAVFILNHYIKQFMQESLIDGKLLGQRSLIIVDKLPAEMGIIGGIVVLIVALRFLFLKYEVVLTRFNAKVAENKQINRLISKTDYLLAAIISFIVFVLYYKGLTYFFIRDDLLILNIVKKLSSWKDVAELFNITNPIFRPITFIYYLIAYKLFGLNPTGYHILDASSHVINGILLYFIVQRITQKKLIGFLAVFVFIIRFSHFYDVLWIGVGDPFMTIFCLLTILFYLKSSEKKVFFLLSFICYVVSILIKEISYAVPLLLFSYEWIKRDRTKSIFKTIIAILKKQAFYLIVSLFVFGFRLVSKSDWITNESSMYYMSFDKTTLSNLLNYIRFSFDGPFDPALCLIIIFIAYAIFSLKNGYSVFDNDTSIPYKKLVGYGIIWFLISLLPVLFIQVSSTYWMYLAQVGFAITIACIFYYFVYMARRYHPASGSLLVVAFCILGFINTSEKINYKMTKEKLTLWETATIGETFLQVVQRAYPKLPKGSTVYFTPMKDSKEGEYHIKNITYDLLYQLFYDDDSLKTLYLDPKKKDQIKITDDKTYVFAFDRYHLYNLTPSFFNKQK